MAGSAAGLKLYLNETFSELRLDSVAQWMEVGACHHMLALGLRPHLRELPAERIPGFPRTLGSDECGESKAYYFLSSILPVPSILKPGLPTSPLWPTQSGRVSLQSSWWLS